MKILHMLFQSHLLTHFGRSKSIMQNSIRSFAVCKSQAFLIPTLVEANTALKHHSNPNVKFVDGSWHLGNTRKPYEEFVHERIAGSQYFDIDKISDTSSSLPHMIPSEEKFAEEVSKLGISSDDHVIVYTVSDSFSYARVWWMFRLFGHSKVSILNGGLNAWKAVNGPLETGTVTVPPRGDFKAKLNQKMVVNADQVLEAVNTGASQIVDARSGARFRGEVPEPRPGLARGHIPGSLSLPFTQIVKEGDTSTLKPLAKIRDEIVDSGVIMGSRVILSCGSGVTAAVVCLGFHLLGKDLENSPIYDGSWSEWGARDDLPKVTP